MSQPEFDHLPLSLILIDRDARQRREIDTSGLKESIALYGVLQPIIVERAAEGGQHRLIAGERRLTACQELDLATVPVRFLDSLSPIEAQIIELEENIKRSDLTWQESARATATIHELYCQQDDSWTQVETAAMLGTSGASISRIISVARALDDPQIAECDNMRMAYNLLARRANREASSAMQSLLEAADRALAPLAGPSPRAEPEPEGEDEIEPNSGLPSAIRSSPSSGAPLPARMAKAITLDPAKAILHESFIQWAPRYSGVKFNFIHCDFPYGVNLFDGSQAGGVSEDYKYSDSADTYWKLLEALATNWSRLASVSGHMLFWYSEKHGDATRAFFRERLPGLRLSTHSLIWVKSDNAGIVADVRRDPRHVYETAIFASWGNRHIVKVVADAYSAPTDRKYHPSTKPVPVLRHFFQMIVDEHTIMLDPTCGSGSALRAAESMGAKQVLGMDADEQIVGTARMVLRQERGLRSITKA